MRYVVAGGTGLIGRRLTESWLRDGAEVVVLSRSPRTEPPAGSLVVRWDGRSAGPWSTWVEGAEAVVNLAGENLGAKRWSERRKHGLRSSRIEPTRALVEAIAKARRRPATLLQASAVGYYGDRGDEELGENAGPGSGFLAELCQAWEIASAEVETLGVRRVLLRTGVVLGREGGALSKMLPPFRWGVGGRLGDGRQWFSWIHLDDAVSAIRFLAGRPDLSGAFNLAAPAPVTNAELTRALGHACRRPAAVHVPPFVLRALLGEMAEVLLGGQRALPERLSAASFRFEHREIGAALAALLGRRH